MAEKPDKQKKKTAKPKKTEKSVLGALEEDVQLFEIGLVEVHLGHRERDLGEGQDAHLLPLQEQPLHLFEFLQINY